MFLLTSYRLFILYYSFMIVSLVLPLFPVKSDCHLCFFLLIFILHFSKLLIPIGCPYIITSPKVIIIRLVTLQYYFWKYFLHIFPPRCMCIENPTAMWIINSIQFDISRENVSVILFVYSLNFLSMWYPKTYIKLWIIAKLGPWNFIIFSNLLSTF